jgi:hypothetical protein
MSNVVSKIYSMPRDFHLLGNKSMIQLLIESGYLNEIQLVTKETISTYLAENPDLIIDWENYSSDKRVSKGWYFLKRGSDWIVGYSGSPSQEQKLLFSSEFEAYAEFILREVAEIAEYTKRK